MAKRAFILGDGQIGRAIAATLRAGGWSVSVGRRSPTEVPTDELITLDRATPGALAQAIGDGVDAVIDTIAFDAVDIAPWAAAASRIGTLVVISSMSVYKDADGRTLDEARDTGFPCFPIPIHEDHARVDPAPMTYSTRKVAMEDAVTALDLPTVVLRPCAIYGIGSRAPREWWFIQRALAGDRTIPVAWDGQSRFHPVAARTIAEVARVAIAAGGSHVLNAVDAICPTVAEIGSSILSAMGSRARLALFAGPPDGMVGRTPWSIPHSMIGSMSAAEALGYRAVTSYAEEIPAVCAALIAEAQAKGWEGAFPGLAAYPPGFFPPTARR